MSPAPRIWQSCCGHRQPAAANRWQMGRWRRRCWCPMVRFFGSKFLHHERWRGRATSGRYNISRWIDRADNAKCLLAVGLYLRRQFDIVIGGFCPVLPPGRMSRTASSINSQPRNRMATFLDLGLLFNDCCAGSQCPASLDNPSWHRPEVGRSSGR